MHPKLILNFLGILLLFLGLSMGWVSRIDLLAVSWRSLIVQFGYGIEDSEIIAGDLLLPSFSHPCSPGR